MGRECEACGVKMPFGVSRRKNADGKKVCEGCRAGRPGRPRSQGSVRPGRATTAGVVIASQWKSRFEHMGDSTGYFDSPWDNLRASVYENVAERMGYEWEVEDDGAFWKACHDELVAEADAMGLSTSGALRHVAAGEPCTIAYADGRICGKPAVTSFTSRDGDTTYYECAEHAYEGGSAPAGGIDVGSKVRIRYANGEREGVVEKAGPVNLQVRIQLNKGGDKLVSVRREDASIVRSGVRHIAEFPPPENDDSGGDEEAPEEDPLAEEPAPGDPVANAAPPPPPAPSSQPPDRQSDAIVRVCPFCGSGSVTGNADGSIECGHDGIIFTIEVQPRHLGQPLVNPDGTPFEPDFEEGDSYPDIGVAGAEQMADPLADTTVPNPGEDPAVPSGGSTPAPGQDPAGLNALQSPPAARGAGGVPAPGQDPRTAIRRR
jgi:hypothetical protein